MQNEKKIYVRAIRNESSQTIIIKTDLEALNLAIHLRYICRFDPSAKQWIYRILSKSNDKKPKSVWVHNSNCSYHYTGHCSTSYGEKVDPFPKDLPPGFVWATKEFIVPKEWHDKKSLEIELHYDF